jgi:S-adenosylmethionine hydrolase
VGRALSDEKIVALLTDYGVVDNYVASVKATILRHAPNAKFVDITHDIPPQNVRLGAFQLMTCFETFPAGTLFLCVVDPGVGTDRKVIYAEAGSYQFVAPDNGLLSWAFSKAPPRVVMDVSGEGRDIMAPFVGQLIAHEKPASLGTSLSSWTKLLFPSVKKMGSQWTGEVLAVDSFGNLITNIRTEEIEPLAASSKLWIDLGSKQNTVRGLSKTYADVAAGKLLVFGGSSGFLEISQRDGNAAIATALTTGAPIVVKFLT